MVAALNISRSLDGRVVAVFGSAAVIAFLALPAEYMSGNGRMWVYPIVAVMSVAAVWFAAERNPAFLRSAWLVYLGKISFGLYVFHLLGLHIGERVFPKSLPLHFSLGLIATIAMAALSYHFFEKPFNNRKARLEVVKSRPD